MSLTVDSDSSDHASINSRKKVSRSPTVPDFVPGDAASMP
jgi:hypothetical protein